jgi:hypothetical protein
MVNVNSNINDSKLRLAITSTPCLILKKPTRVVRTHLEGEFGQTDLEHSQQSRISTTPAAAVMVSFPIFVHIAPRRIGLTPGGSSFAVGRVAAQRGCHCSSEARNQPANKVSVFRGTVSKSFNLSIASYPAEPRVSDCSLRRMRAMC